MADRKRPRRTPEADPADPAGVADAVADPGAGGADAVADPGWTWVPAAEAAERCAVSRSAVKKWYASGAVPSRMEVGPSGQEQRFVPLEAVAERAGRTARPSTPEAGSPGVAMVPMSDLAPLFDRLADAERRAVRAETELEFLRERHEAELAEARRQAEQARQAVESAPPPRRGWFKR